MTSSVGSHRGLLSGYYTSDRDIEERSGIVDSPSSTRAPSSVAVATTPATPGSSLGRLLLCFSALTNGQKILGLDTDHSRDTSLQCLHGIRVLSMAWVILGHTHLFALSFIDNPADLLLMSSRASFRALHAGTLSVDSFFFLSGLLIAYLFVKQCRQKECRMSAWDWTLYYLHRFLRLTPAYMFCVMLIATIYTSWLSGPLVVRGEAEPVRQACQEYWWTNLLYINNFHPDFGALTKQCMGWSWYLANDMQFFALSPFLLYMCAKRQKAGLVVTGLLTFTCMVARGVASYTYGIPAYPWQLMLDDPQASTTAIMYTKPYFRAAPYLVGLGLGTVLADSKMRGWTFSISRAWSLAGWLTVLLGMACIVYIEQMVTPDGPMDALSRLDAAVHNALVRPVWAFCLAWVVLACFFGHGGPVHTILAWRVWGPLARLTYSAYLVHPMVIVAYYMSRRTLMHYTDVDMAYMQVGNWVFSYGFAFILSLLVEAPMMGIEKLVLRR